MGYDMYLEQTDPEAKAKSEALTAEFHAAAKQRNAATEAGDEAKAEALQAEVSRLYDAMNEADTNYYRLNIWGMSRMRTLMEAVPGMLNDYAREGSWPEASDFSIPDGVDPYDEDSTHPEVVRFHAASAAVRDRETGHSGIPYYKLGTNDGWLVSPAECESAVQAWQEHVNDHGLTPEEAADALAGSEDGEPLGSWFLRWIDWLERASKAGGFRVY